MARKKKISEELRRALPRVNRKGDKVVLLRGHMGLLALPEYLWSNLPYIMTVCPNSGWEKVRRIKATFSKHDLRPIVESLELVATHDEHPAWQAVPEHRRKDFETVCGQFFEVEGFAASFLKWKGLRQYLQSF